MIEARKSRIQKELIDLDPLDVRRPTDHYKDIDIVDFYDILFSDTPKIIKGRRWKSIGEFMYHHMGGFKIKCQPFKQKGPKYYIGAEGVTFENCPVYSEKVFEYHR